MIEDDDVSKAETEETAVAPDGVVAPESAEAQASSAPPPFPPMAGHMAEVEAASKSDEELPPISDEELERIRRDIVAAIKTVYDPEIPVDIYELGLIYRVDIENDRSVLVEMTLTSPGCPVAGDMPGWVVDAVLNVEGVRKAKAVLSFDPPWDMSMMSEEARFALNMF